MSPSPLPPRPPVLRFAPSSNGHLHLGNAFSALETHRIAAETGGRFLLRVEDIDPERCRPAYEEAIYEDLAWLGLSWETPVRRQSAHMDDYVRTLGRLRDMDAVYPCWATRREIRNAIAARPGGLAAWPTDPDGQPVYPGLHRRLSADQRASLMRQGRPHAWRLDTARAMALVEARGLAPLTFTEDGQGPEEQHGSCTVRPQTFGDVVVARKDVPTSYHLAVVVDDALQGISLVTRGRGLFHSTGVHRLLQALLDLPTPRYHHHRLIADGDGKRLSKSGGSTALRTLRAQGVSAGEIRAWLGFGPHGHAGTP